MGRGQFKAELRVLLNHVRSLDTFIGLHTPSHTKAQGQGKKEPPLFKDHKDKCGESTFHKHLPGVQQGAPNKPEKRHYRHPHFITEEIKALEVK